MKNLTFNERARGIRLGWEVLRYAFTRKGLLTTARQRQRLRKVMPGVATPDVQLDCTGQLRRTARRFG